MHEVALMQDVLELALEHAARQGASRIRKIGLRIGELSGVVAEALEFAFEVVTQSTLAEGAELAIEQVPAAFRCLHCQQEYQPDTLGDPCPFCQAFENLPLRGRELELAYLEVT